MARWLPISQNLKSTRRIREDQRKPKVQKDDTLLPRRDCLPYGPTTSGTTRAPAPARGHRPQPKESLVAPAATSDAKVAQEAAVCARSPEGKGPAKEETVPAMRERRRRKAAGGTKHVVSRIPSGNEGTLDPTCFVSPAALRRFLSPTEGTACRKESWVPPTSCRLQLCDATFLPSQALPLPWQGPCPQAKVCSQRPP